MRFVSLEVKSFQAIAHAGLEFAPQLNVLFGPNDLGKSTLVTALRAALLVPAKSAEGQAFVPWYRDASPQVVLVFEADDGRLWRVIKTFGEGKAELASSKDGRDYTLEAKAREVDQKLRTMLPWGAADLGGKARGGFGIPDTFLSNVLLGAQTGVDDILARGVDGDDSESAKKWLTRALAALAEDPLFKHVLDKATAELDQYFTETGRRRGGARSRFAVVGDEVKKLADELAQARAQLDQSASTEGLVAKLRHEVDVARQQLKDATVMVDEARRGVERSRSRVTAEAQVAEARAALARIDEVLRRAETLRAEVTSLEATVAEDDAALRRADEATRAAGQATKSAEEALQRAQSQEGARARELQRANLTSRKAELEATIATLAPRLEKAQAAQDSVKQLAAVEAEAARLQRELDALDGQAQAAKQGVEVARLILDYGRWKDAEKGAERASRARAELVALEQKAKAVREQLAAGEAELGRREAALTAAQSGLPSTEQVAAFARLEADRRVADAQAGGGLSVVVRPREEVRLHAEVDDEAPVDEVVRANKDRAFDAERKVTLALGQMVELEIVAGTKAARQQRDTLSKRWRNEVLPALTKAEVTSVAELQARHDALAKERSELQGLASNLERWRSEERSAREQVALIGRQGSGAESAEALQRRRDRIPQEQLAMIAAAFDSLGAGWELQTERAERDQQRALETMVEAQTKVRAALAVASERKASLGAAAASAHGQGDVTVLAQQLTVARNEQAKLVVALQALEAEQGAEVKTAQQALEKQRSLATAAEQSRVAARQKLDASRALLHERRGQAGALEAEVARLDRPKAQHALDAADAALAPLRSSPVVTPEQLAEAEQLLSAIRDQSSEKEAEFHKADGALSKVGGPQLREHVQQLEEALAAAKDREKEVELDAESWQLLQQTLRDSENAQGGHLGRALAVPLAAQFTELTKGRYGTIELGPDLTTLSVKAEGAMEDGAVVLDALSVGTRDQLASLLRVAVARQLKTALVLDDHLVHTDADRMGWFVEALRKSALAAQVLVFTCRPFDYVPADVLDGKSITKDLGGGSLRLVDLSRVIEPWPERKGR
ncbi:MAG: AAA family ATPase [Myxococcaceae bacterium]|nr:AAA family ATPase [Myxococcaceae bacterium]